MANIRIPENELPIRDALSTDYVRVVGTDGKSYRVEKSGMDMTVDSALSSTSENPVQNKVVTESVSDLQSDVSDLKSDLDDSIGEITEETRNLWQDGDVEITTSGTYNGYTQFLLKNPLESGTYTLSTIASSSNTARNNMIVIFSTSQENRINSGNIIATLYLTKSARRTSVSFTISSTAYSVRVQTNSTLANSSGYTGNLVDVMVEEGTRVSAYVSPKTAVDYLARDIELLDYADNVALYNDFASGYIDTSGTSIAPNTVLSKDYMSHIIIDCEEGDKFKVIALGGNASRLQYVFCDSNWNILSKSLTYSESWNSWFLYDNSDVVAPSGSKYMLVNHFAYYTSYSPKIIKLSSSAEINNMSSIVPKPQKPYWKANVIAVYRNMIATLESGVVKLSTDSGRTWNNGVDISAVATSPRAYLYANGNLAFFTDQKAYVITDWNSYQEAPCYEADGTTVYTPSSSENFSTYWTYNERKFINGVDMYVFGNYHTTDTVRSIIWYSVDSGLSYRIAFEFGSRETTTPTGSWQIRHIHSVFYYEPKDIFLVSTGDENATECMIFSLTYTNGAWSVAKLAGSAREYKWTSFAVWNDKIYYTNDNSYGSVWKCAYDDISNISAHECVYDGLYNDADLVTFGKNGDMLVMISTVRNLAGQNLPSPFGTREGARVFHYSSDRKTFNELHLPVSFIRGICSPNYYIPIASNGDIYARIRNDNVATTLCLSDIVRNAGFKAAFEPLI